MLAESSVKNRLHWETKKAEWIRFYLKDKKLDNIFLHFLYQFSREYRVFCVWSPSHWSFERFWNWSVFFCWRDLLNDVHVPKHLVSRNYLQFVQTSLLIVIRQYLKKRRMLFINGILFSANVRYTKKSYFGTALSCLICCISCSCWMILRKRGKFPALEEIF